MTAPTTLADPLAHCVFCGRATDGPLAGCEDPECVRLEIEMDMEFVRGSDV
jgi:hypothetical protein